MALLLQNNPTQNLELHLNTDMKLVELSPSLPTSPSILTAVDLSFNQSEGASKRMFWLEDHNAGCEKDQEQRNREFVLAEEPIIHEVVEEPIAVVQSKTRSPECIRISTLVNAINSNYSKFLQSLAASQGQPLLSSPLRSIPLEH